MSLLLPELVSYHWQEKKKKHMPLPKNIYLVPNARLSSRKSAQRRDGGRSPNLSCIPLRSKRSSTRPGQASWLYMELQIEADLKHP